jgi:hypothetical protein
MTGQKETTGFFCPLWINRVFAFLNRHHAGTNRMDVSDNEQY